MENVYLEGFEKEPLMQLCEQMGWSTASFKKSYSEKLMHFLFFRGCERNRLTSPHRKAGLS